MAVTSAFLKGAVEPIEHCPVRGGCPVGSLCGLARVEGAEPIYPTVEQVAGGELVWTDLRYEQRVRFIRRGVFAFVPNFDCEESLTTSLFGAGHSVGLAELYIPRAVAGTYHLHAVTDGELCSFPGKALKRHLEALPPAESLSILACSLTNLVETSCTQLRTVSKTSLRERIVLLFARLRGLEARQGGDLREVRLTHEEIAGLVASDRGSVTRALRKLKQDGLIELGYKSVRFSDELCRVADACSDVHLNFQQPKTDRAGSQADCRV